MRWIIPIVLLITGGLGCQLNDTAPNVLFIMTDQHPLSCVGAYGNQVIQTPNLNHLASEGHLLKNFYIAAFACSPSRASFLTGRFLHHHNVFTNNVILDPDIPSLGVLLEQAGYQTGYFGKAHLGGYMYAGRTGGDGVDYLHGPKDAMDPVGEKIQGYWHHERIEAAAGWLPKKQPGGAGEDRPQLGFSTWKGGWKDYKNWLVDQGRPDFAAMAGNHDALQSAPEGAHMYSRLGEKYHMAKFFTDEAEKFISRASRNEKPWAAVLSYFGPHLPVSPPQPWDTMYSLDQVTLPVNLNDDLTGKPRLHYQPQLQYVRESWQDDQFRDYIRRYWGYSSYIDDQIGRIFKLLKATNLWNNTIIVFSTDHGDMVAGHGMIFKLGANAYEELFHVPAIIRIPEIRPSQNPIDPLTSSIDILPTILEAAKVDLPAGIDGQSLLPLLRGQTTDNRTEVFAEIHAMGAGKIIMCRTDRYKYVYHWLSDDVDELYDLKEDPAEMTNLYKAPTHRAIVQSMRDKIITWSEQTGHRYHKLIAQKALSGD